MADNTFANVTAARGIKFFYNCPQLAAFAALEARGHVGLSEGPACDKHGRSAPTVTDAGQLVAVRSAMAGDGPSWPIYSTGFCA